MKYKFGITVYCLILIFCLTACRGQNNTHNYYSNFTSGGEGNSYSITGNAAISDSLPLLYLTSSKDTNLTIEGNLKSISGDVQIVYMDPSNEVTVIADGKDAKKGQLEINTKIDIFKGDGRLEFRGNKTKLKFGLTFPNIDEETFYYFSTQNKETEIDHLLQETTVSYTDQDSTATVLSTETSENKKIKV